MIFVGVLMLLVALGFGIAALADFFLLVRVSVVRCKLDSIARDQSKESSFTHTLLPWLILDSSSPVKVHRIYRSTGASMAKAQAEFTSGMMKNESVRQAAADAASASVRGAFNGNATSGGGGGGGQPAAGGRF